MNKLEEKWGWWLVIIGGINWGLVGLGYFLKTNLNVINLVLGNWPTIENIVYVLVGLCALWIAYLKMGRR